MTRERSDDMDELVRLRIVGDDSLDEAAAAFAARHGRNPGSIRDEVDLLAEPRLADLDLERRTMENG